MNLQHLFTSPQQWISVGDALMGRDELYRYENNVFTLLALMQPGESFSITERVPEQNRTVFLNIAAEAVRCYRRAPQPIDGKEFEWSDDCDEIRCVKRMHFFNQLSTRSDFS